ncbi:alpha/beta hydrolase, partial [uncultured Hymenobacter sp.]|uniref:alpha/beta hydrolase n=1 Tax=uncultured Hymenobacter sp. TaxID=170016 RepID=UPI0035C9DA66
FAQNRLETTRHRTSWLEAGPVDGPLVFFLHGWPELGLVWHAQLAHFAASGWRCIAPDMRGYGGSAVPTATGAYAVRELVADMVELHESLGGAPAVWVGHDWGSPVVWALAAHHADRCRAVVSLCVPYLARGLALPTLLPLVDRALYPVEQYPAGQWEYFLFYRENFAQAAHDFEADVAATLALLYRAGSPEAIGKPAPTAAVRAQGGWFGPAHRAPAMPRDTALLSPADYNTLVAAFSATGFRGANAWYLNDAANLAYAAEAPNFGRLTLPVLFLHAEWDTVCDSVHSRLAEPMRMDCTNLHEVTIEGGHELMLERPAEVNAALDAWFTAEGLR